MTKSCTASNEAARLPASHSVSKPKLFLQWWTQTPGGGLLAVIRGRGVLNTAGGILKLSFHYFQLNFLLQSQEHWPETK